MQQTLDGLIREWDGLAVVSRYDRPSGTWIFIALHDDRLGRPVGGTRLRAYPEPAAALGDAMRLAEGMTHKWAALGLDAGGGKAVLAVPGPLDGTERRGLLRRYGALLNCFGGLFATGRDLGTTDDDMRVIGEASRHVHGVDFDTGEVKDPGPYTATGVMAAVRAVLRRVHGSADPRGRRVMVQGTGAVGAPLARSLAAAGARVTLCDADAAKATALADEIGAETVSTDAAYDVACDVWAPCAVGGVLNAETIPRLRCRAVAGSANNQLADAADAERLHERGILYAPDFVANAGGALAFWLIHRGGTDDAELLRRVAGIEDSLGRIFEAAAGGESPLRAARRQVDRALAAGPSE